MNEKNLQEEKSSILTLILSSILLHLLIMLAIIFYRFELDKSYEIPRVTSDDQVVLWTNPPQTIQQQTQPPQPKLQPEPKKEEPKTPSIAKKTIIIPGRQGINQQDIDEKKSLIPAENSPEEINNKKGLLKETAPVKKEPFANKSYKSISKNPEIPSESGKKILQPKTDIIREDSIDSFTSNNEKQSNLPDNKEKLNENNDKTNTPEQIRAKKKEMIFDTDLSFLGKKTLQEKLIEKDEKYENVPKVQENKTKSISFQDIGLGFNKSSINVGNSSSIILPGSSPDIPQGDELKYVTYLNQMANLFITAMRTNPQINFLPRYSGERVVFFMKVTREGKLLDVHMVIPSKHEIINSFIIESVKMVGLFNPLPKFIDKETFQMNWQSLY